LELPVFVAEADDLGAFAAFGRDTGPAVMISGPAFCAPNIGPAVRPLDV
jgi:hypothetical protein